MNITATMGGGMGYTSIERKEIYYVHGVQSGGASRYSDVWTLVADRYYYYYYIPTTYLPVDLYNNIILYVQIYYTEEKEEDNDEDDSNAFKVSWAIIKNTHVITIHGVL